MDMVDDISAGAEGGRDAVVQAHRCGRCVPARQRHHHRCDLLMFCHYSSINSICQDCFILEVLYAQMVRSMFFPWDLLATGSSFPVGHGNPARG